MTLQLITIFIAVGLVAIAYLIYRSRHQIAARERAAAHEMEVIEQARRIPLPEKAVSLRTDASSGDVYARDGRIMLVLVGTFGENFARFLLTMLAQAGLDRAIGSVLLLEFDDSRREQFRLNMPQAFADKVVYVSGAAGGFSGRAREDVRQVIVRWGPEVTSAVRDVVSLHQRRNSGQEPSLILSVLGLGGGHSEVGAEVIRQLSTQLRDTSTYGIAVFPIHDKLRSRAMDVIKVYEGAGVRGWILADNLQDPVQNDFGMISAIAAFIGAPRDADAAVEINNALMLILEETPGHIATLTTYARSLPAYRFQRHDKLPDEFYVWEDSVRTAIVTGIEIVRTSADSLGYLAPATLPANTTVFDLVLAPIVIDDLKMVEDKVIQGFTMSEGQRRNYQLQVASVAMQINPEVPECPIAVIQVRPLVNGFERIKELAAPQPYQFDALPSGGMQSESVVSQAKERRESDV